MGSHEALTELMLGDHGIPESIPFLRPINNIIGSDEQLMRERRLKDRN